MPSRDRAILNLANSFIFHVDPNAMMWGGGGTAGQPTVLFLKELAHSVEI